MTNNAPELVVPGVSAGLQMEPCDPAWSGLNSPRMDLLSAGGGSPLPSSDPNLWLWVTSDFGTTYDPGNRRMSTTNDWLDRSGNNRHLSSSIERYTIFLPTELAAVPMPSGKPIIRFDPTDLGTTVPTQFTSLTNLVISNLTRPCTIYLLLNVPVWAYPEYFFDGACQVGGTLYANTAGISMQPNMDTRVGLSAPELFPKIVDTWNPLVLNQWIILTAKFSGNYTVDESPQADKSSLQFNNNTVVYGNTESFPVPGRQPQGAWIGGIPTVGDWHARFDLGACIISHAANSDAIQAIHKNYLAAYAGISI